MQRSRSSARVNLASFVLMQVVVVTMIGGTAMVIGRSKEVRRGLRSSNGSKILDDPKWSNAVENAQRALDEARQNLATSQGKRFQEQLTQRAHEQFSQRAENVIDSTRENMPTSMKDAGELARDLAERLRVEGQARSAELSQRLRDEVAPKAKTYAQEAIEEAESLFSTARGRANELSKNARRDYGPEVSNKANALAGLIAAGSTTGLQMLRERADELSKANKGKPGAKLARKANDKASTALQTAGSQAKYVAGESMMLGLWATLLGATIYFAILSKSQRERVKGFFSNAFSQIQDVMGDFQSTDDDFPRSTR